MRATPVPPRHLVDPFSLISSPTYSDRRKSQAGVTPSRKTGAVAVHPRFGLRKVVNLAEHRCGVIPLVFTCCSRHRGERCGRPLQIVAAVEDLKPRQDPLSPFTPCPHGGRLIV